ncbi:zinc finger MYM-type protein [Trifolium repens]|nr:zinc finger MYM-type protein [Trifolium repens]
MSAIDILKIFKDTHCYPNLSIAYIVLLTMSVTVASTERSFSKLKLIKTYLRSSISQERFDGLTTWSIENDVLENIDINVIIKDFAYQNARKNRFL